MSDDTGPVSLGGDWLTCGCCVALVVLVKLPLWALMWHTVITQGVLA